MLAPIDKRTGKPVPKKDRKKFIADENGFYGRDIDRAKEATRRVRGPYAGLKPVKVEESKVEEPEETEEEREAREAAEKTAKKGK